MSLSGFGTSPVGSTPFGFGVPTVAPTPPSTVPEGARFIDPFTGDYVLDSEGEYERISGVRQRVVVALTTRKGSSAVLQTFGLKLPDKIDATFQQRVTNAVRAALSHLIAVKPPVIRLDAVEVQTPQPGRAYITVRWTDLTNGQPEFVTF